MFDSPMEHCAICGEMVTLDQTLSECERKHGCGVDQACPLRYFFGDASRCPGPQGNKPPNS